jgi:hypothetical protein
VKPPLTQDVNGPAPVGWPDRPETGPVSSRPTASDEFLQQRVSSLLELSARFGTGIPVRDLTALLPPEGPEEPEALERWLAVRPDLARVRGERAFAPEAIPSGLEERLARGRRYRAVAERLLESELGALAPWIRCAAITGSAAYGEPKSGDDLDFFFVTRSGTMWLCLLSATLAVRLRYRPTDSDARPRPCFNFVLDERTAPGEFRSRRGFLFAREALTAQVLRGDAYYRSLLSSAPWLGEEIPRLYAGRATGPPPDAAVAVPWPVRLLNAILFPPLATYLHLIGMYRNHRQRRQGDSEKAFRTKVAFRRLAVPTDRFDQLSAAVDSASRTARSRSPTGR